MKKIKAIIERAKDGTYSIYCEDFAFSGMGETEEEAKSNMAESMAFFKQTCIEDKKPYPAFLDKPYTFEYTFDAESAIVYYSHIISLAGMSRLTGINRRQLWSYAHGRSKPRKEQVSKIREGLHRLGKELSSVSF